MTSPAVEVTASREAQVGRFPVRRALPTRGRRTVGAWCFADHMGPADVDETSGLDVAPHPHIGLHTVTWLIDGQALHRDSLGSEQVIRAGELNLMTAGNGVSHSEEATGHYRGTLQGIQLWVAMPEATRHGAAAFEHHATLPRIDVPGGDVTVLVGEYAGLASPARRDTELIGLDVVARDGVELGLRPDFEHGVIVLEGEVLADGIPVTPGHLAYLAPGRDEITLDPAARARLLVLGGVPFEAPVTMWWNFVGRSQSELSAAYLDWRDGHDRFGRVASAMPRIEVAAPPWLRE